ncbi:MAG: pyridoxal phosphate-dependent aminotransferase [Xanthomonadaceae bacterium]|nr:pyridoxal phosphate-dependent aminotransferase [Xanthomonadaceae bacterium]
MSFDTKLPNVGTTIFTLMSQLAAEHGAINLGQGFPDFDVPVRLVDELNQAVRAGHNQYPPMIGVASLRQAIAEKINHCHCVRVDPDAEVTVVSGATEALFNAIHAVVHPGEEVIVLDPAYDSYDPAIELAGAQAVHVPLDTDTFAVDWDKVRAAITSKTRALLINSPHNPTGAVLGQEDLLELTDILRGTRILLISDEVYEHIVYDGRQHESVLRHPELARRAFVISSFGKTYHCTGWKLGYAVAAPALTAEFRKVHQYNTFASFSPAQYAFAAMLRDEPEHYLTLGRFYQEKRDYFRRSLSTTKLRPLPVAGGYFQLVDYSQVSDLPDDEFVKWMTVEKGVAAIPLSSFYRSSPPGQCLIRLCFAKNQSTLDSAIERLRAL